METRSTLRATPAFERVGWGGLGVQTNPKKIDRGAAYIAKCHCAGSAHGMTAMAEAEGMTRRAQAAQDGPGEASASRKLVRLWRGFSRACWLGLQTVAIESGDVLMAPSLRLPATHGRDGGYIGPACVNLVQVLLMASACVFRKVCKRKSALSPYP